MKSFKNLLGPVFITITLSTVLTSCLYEMPSDDQIHTTPLTNNPDVTQDNNSMMMPGAEY
ncbi:MAG: hypothetical protein JHC93_06560 [Parachlamydiales bacterium]|nr:hypothetical protein [Parachlamydiales bacterium]